ncbi:hypothetical protein ACFPYJ_09695 [Paenibacillus solisilvae]|uniref:Uncharacterized protein n=1 Tax=Paenibacillus solisilvae TaxID=2486751 RepID=A0ABW0VXG1_9BACL
MKWIWVAAAVYFIVFVEGIALIKKGSRRDSVTFIILLGIAASMSAAQSFGIAIPNPNDWYDWVFTPLSRLVKGVLY